MQFPTPSDDPGSRAPGSPNSPSPVPPRADDVISARDAVRLLVLMGSVSVHRGNPRTWRLDLLGGINDILKASASAAFILKNIQEDASELTLVSLFDVGFKLEAHQQAFSREFNVAPFRDPLSRFVLERLISRRLTVATCLRSEAVDDDAWKSDQHVRAYRRPSGADDCLFSLQRGSERGAAYGLMAFKPAVAQGDEGGAEGAPRSSQRFTAYDRLLLDSLHRGLEGFYRSEEATQKLNRGAGLTPRLRQTLEFLLAGNTERQVAIKMSLSVHTVHDYVKALYQHFGVSSRNELLAKWMHTGGQLPKRPES